MIKTRKFFIWLLSVPEAERTLGSVVAWWELRRIPYNIIVGCIAFFSLIIFFVSITSAHVLGPGEDPVEPLAFIIDPSSLISVIRWVGLQKVYCGLSGRVKDMSGGRCSSKSV